MCSSAFCYKVLSCFRPTALVALVLGGACVHDPWSARQIERSDLAPIIGEHAAKKKVIIYLSDEGCLGCSKRLMQVLAEMDSACCATVINAFQGRLDIERIMSMEMPVILDESGEFERLTGFVRSAAIIRMPNQEDTIFELNVARIGEQLEYLRSAMQVSRVPHE